jgi:hypothetical protein
VKLGEKTEGLHSPDFSGRYFDMENAGIVNDSDDRPSMSVRSDRFSQALFNRSQKDLRKNEVKELRPNDDEPCDHLIATYWG